MNVVYVIEANEGVDWPSCTEIVAVCNSRSIAEKLAPQLVKEHEHTSPGWEYVIVEVPIYY